MKRKGTLSLSLSRSRLPRTVATCTLVFLLCLGVGFLSGTFLKNNEKDTQAASASITVVDNNQVVTEDQGTPTITRTSTVTIKDPTATLGYTLSAQISQNTIPPTSTVSIYSTSSTSCTQSSPCMLNTSSPVQILETTTNTATSASGHTTDWTVTIILPSTTSQGNYIVDIAYGEEGKYPRQCPVLQGKTYLQDITPGTLSTHGTDRERVALKDRRNNQDYYVQNILNQDGTCTLWMETNLRYAGDGAWDNTWGYDDDRYATTTTLASTTANPNDNTRPLIMTTSGYMGNTTTSADAYTVAGVKDAGGSPTLDTTTPTNNTTSYGYLYNWCAAMGGQTNACNYTETNQANLDTTTSICPAGWRLPTGTSSGDFYKLNRVVNGGSTSSSQGLIDSFLAVYSGSYGSGLGGQGAYGYYWSSTVYDATSVYNLSFDSTIVRPGTYYSSKYGGRSIRCVLN